MAQARTERNTQIETVDVGLDEEAPRTSIEILNKLLADEVLLYVKTKRYHWNVTGPWFYQYHQLFEAQYEVLDEIQDEVAERVRALGGRPVASLAGFLDQARLEEDRGDTMDAPQMVERLLSDHESVVRFLREGAEECEDAGDMGTNDFLIALMEKHEKMAWMLRASRTDTGPRQ